MALSTVEIKGTLHGPDGEGLPGGTIICTLSNLATVSGEAVDGRVEIRIGADGGLNFNLVPTDAMEPAGTRWIAEYRLPLGVQRGPEIWSIPSSPASIDFGAILRESALSVSALLPLLPTMTALPEASATWHRRPFMLALPGQTEQVVVARKTGSGGYEWYEL